MSRLCAAVVIGGLLVRLVRLAMQSPLWGDEAMLVHSFFNRGYADLLQPLDYVQIAPLGFLWAELTCYHWLGPAEWVWRLVPTLAGCFALLAFISFSRKVLPRHAAWLAIGIVASSLYLVRHTVEAKPYIIDFALALALLQLGWRIHQVPNCLRRWVIFGLIATIGVWCSFPMAFVAGGILLSLLPVIVDEVKVGEWRRLAAWLACGSCLTASFVTMYLIFGRVQNQTAEMAGYWQMSMWEVAYPPWQRPDLFLVWLVREHAGAMMAHPFGGKNFASLGTLVLVIAGVVVLYRRNLKLTWMLLAPATLGLLAACLQKYPYGGTARTMLYLAPAICLFAGLGAWTLIVQFCSATRRRTLFSWSLAGCLVLIVVRLVVEIVCPYKQYADWLVRDAVRRWAFEAKPNDVWIIANAAAVPDREREGIFGGNTVVVFDHYATLSMGERVVRPREVIDCPRTAGEVVLLIHESSNLPSTIEIGQTFQERFSDQARLLREDILTLDGQETLRRLVFSPDNLGPFR